MRDAIHCNSSTKVLYVEKIKQINNSPHYKKHSARKHNLFSEASNKQILLGVVGLTISLKTPNVNIQKLK